MSSAAGPADWSRRVSGEWGRPGRGDSGGGETLARRTVADNERVDCSTSRRRDSSPPDEDVVSDDLPSSIDEALSQLRDREARVLRLYFGFEGNEAMTLEEIGQELGVTRERVRQIKERALGKLRRSTTATQLESFAHA